MSLVCVPLDVEDTLNCYRQALDRRPYCLQVFQHSRSLLLLLLAYTQPCEFSADWGDTYVHYHTTTVFALPVFLSRLCITVGPLSGQKSQLFSKRGWVQSNSEAHSKHSTMRPDKGGLQYSKCSLQSPCLPWSHANCHCCILHCH